MRDFISIAKPIIGEEEVEAVGEVLRSGMLTQGETVKRFEEEFSKYLNVRNSMDAVAASPIVSHLAQEGKMRLVGAKYHLDTGQVEWFAP